MAEGRGAAREIDRFLMGSSELEAPMPAARKLVQITA
jgi:hypothetical protein